MSDAPLGHLTEKDYWNDYWSKILLPAEIRRLRDHSHNRILAVLDRYLPVGAGLTALEVGGAPGQYLAYLARTKSYQPHLLDYSDSGCAKSRENFRLLGLPISVHLGDLFDPALSIGTFDVVYSLGFIEHFSDLPDIIGRHLRLLKPGGTLLVGVPNFRGINGWFLRRLAPQLLAKHNTDCMDIGTWSEFERKFGLQVLFKGYVGGFEPGVFNLCEKMTPINFALKASARVMRRLCSPRVFKIFNSEQFSHYAIAAYRVPQAPT